MAVFQKKKWPVVIVLLIIITVAWFFLQGEGNHDTGSDDIRPGKGLHSNDSDRSQPLQKGRKIKYWVAPMDPTYIRDKPGKSPMGMDLVPVYEGDEETSDERIVKIDPLIVQNMGVRTATVKRGPLNVSIRTIGHIAYDEELVEHIHTKISGWVEELFVKTTGEEIKKGQKIISIYSPELVATEEEYLQALKYREKVSGSSMEDIITGADALLESTRKRLLLMDIDPEQIKALEESGTVRRDMILHSSSSGIVIKKHVFEGMKVDPGMELFTIADLSRVWAIASVYEYELPFLTVGQETTMRLPYEPGSVYRGQVTFIYPYLSPQTRTVQVRMEFDNPDQKLKPDMYADVVIKSKIAENVLLVPSEAVLKTGYRNIVIAYLGNGKFLPKNVTIGPEGEGVVQILSGLREGETIVTSGQFLIDSESNLREAINKMLKAADIEKTGSEKHDHDMGMTHDMNMKPHGVHEN